MNRVRYIIHVKICVQAVASFLSLETNLPHLKAQRVANLVKIEVLKVAWKKSLMITSCRQLISCFFRWLVLYFRCGIISRARSRQILREGFSWSVNTRAVRQVWGKCPRVVTHRWMVEGANVGASGESLSGYPGALLSTITACVYVISSDST